MSAQFPIGATLTLPQLAQNPYPHFQKMLRDEPISWVPAFDMWMVTRREDVVALLRDADSYTMEPEGEQINPMEDIFGTMMLSLDGPAHKRIRDVFVEPYRPRHSRRFYTSLIETICEQLLDDIAKGAETDLDKSFSDRLAILTVVGTLGFAVDDLTLFRDWYDAFANGIGNTTFDPDIRLRGKAAFQQFSQMVATQIGRLRKQPNQSVLSEIIHHPDIQLTEAEIIANVALTFFGGVETTAAMLSNTLWALFTHPEQFRRVKADPSLLANGLEEAMRWEAPVQSAMRFPRRDVSLHGVKISRGEKIYCMLGAANRDPRFFNRPDQFNITRPNADKHLGFAYGPHFCLGAPLARLEGVIGISKLLARFPNMQLDPNRMQAPYGHEFRSTPTLFVTL